MVYLFYGRGVTLKSQRREYGGRVARITRLLLLAAVSGGLAGAASYAFLEALTWATRTRTDRGWLLWLLPFAGLVIGLIYTRWGGAAARGTRLAVREARALHSGVPSRMAPLVFGCAFLGHLCGASVGREGAAVQMSASLTDTGARWLKLDEGDRQTLLVASLAAGFSSIVGTPVAGVVFAIQLTKRRGPLALLASIVASTVGYETVRLLGASSDYPTIHAPDWTIALPVKLIFAGALFGLVGRLYMWAGDHLSHRVSTTVAWAPLRPVVGGVATVALAALVGRDYLGLSLPLLGKAVTGAHIAWWVPLLKLLFTVIALGSGFVGGEVIPLFVIGATLGATLAGPLHMSPVLLAACGLATLFTTAAQIGVTGVVIATELFGWQATLPAMIVAAAAWATIGAQGLYVNRGESAAPPDGVPSPSH
jgi:H+/Cl- antiporter ClcA